MTLLVLGLVLFLGVHSLRMLAPGWRQARIAAMGANGWRALIAVLSVAGFVLIVAGFGQARLQPVVLYGPLSGARHAVALATLLAFVLVAAAYVPGNHLRRWIGHPMLAGTALWALGHLAAAGRLHDTVLFASFAVWAILDLLVSRRRDRLARGAAASATVAGDALTVVVGVLVWAIFAFWLHARLIGVDVSPI
jgi:uncharacterized membrane protein